jgi:hypothetical protein
MPAEHVEIARLPRFLHTLLASAKCLIAQSTSDWRLPIA